MRKLAIAAGAVMLVATLAAPAPAQLLQGRDVGVERFVPRLPGTEKELTFRFGPFLIPPGQDFNRVTVDLPVHNGFVTSIAPHLLDAATGELAGHDEGHIHHAHWFRASTDPEDEVYTGVAGLGLSWVFGSGEETTRGDVDERSKAEEDGPRYGIYIPGDQPQALIYMLHNKTPRPMLWWVVLDVRFVYGASEQIKAASDCEPLLPGESCAAGQDLRQVRGKLWGSTYNVPRIPEPGVHIHHAGTWTASWSGHIIGGGGHLHPNGMEVVITNLGPAGSGCEADIDGDGFAGVTLFRSKKFDRVPEVWPTSEDYQMGVTHPAWRAPVRAGDRIRQYGVYKNDDHPSYGAMSYTGIYYDTVQTPPTLFFDESVPDEERCLALLRPHLIGDPDGDPTVTVLNREWGHHDVPVCGEGFGPCDRTEQDRPEGIETDLVHIAGFLYTPGDQALAGAAGAPARVKQGTRLRFLNEDVAIGVRHTVTSCPWPCNGPYVANYPQPDGVFDSNRMGSLDPIDGLNPSPEWQAPVLPVGKYAYYCRIHPWMRGAFEVVP